MEGEAVLCHRCKVAQIETLDVKHSDCKVAFGDTACESCDTSDPERIPLCKACFSSFYKALSPKDHAEAIAHGDYVSSKNKIAGAARNKGPTMEGAYEAFSALSATISLLPLSEVDFREPLGNTTLDGRIKKSLHNYGYMLIGFAIILVMRASHVTMFRVVRRVTAVIQLMTMIELLLMSIFPFCVFAMASTDDQYLACSILLFQTSLICLVRICCQQWLLRHAQLLVPNLQPAFQTTNIIGMSQKNAGLNLNQYLDSIIQIMVSRVHTLCVLFGSFIAASITYWTQSGPEVGLPVVIVLPLIFLSMLRGAVYRGWTKRTMFIVLLNENVAEASRSYWSYSRFSRFCDAVFAVFALLPVQDVDSFVDPTHYHFQERLSKSAGIFLSYIPVFLVMSMIYVTSYNMLRWVARLYWWAEMIYLMPVAAAGCLPFFARIMLAVKLHYERDKPEYANRVTIYYFSAIIAVGVVQVAVWIFAMQFRRSFFSDDFPKPDVCNVGIQAVVLPFMSIFGIVLVSIIGYKGLWSILGFPIIWFALRQFRKPLFFCYDTMARMRLESARAQKGRVPVLNGELTETLLNKM
eukprot:m.41286 g.41286  ORF g.41286 m.41286 type:complete len:579 (-) comp9751_c0_seq1:75-1811(-)